MFREYFPRNAHFVSIGHVMHIECLEVRKRCNNVLSLNPEYKKLESQVYACSFGEDDLTARREVISDLKPKLK